MLDTMLIIVCILLFLPLPIDCLASPSIRSSSSSRNLLETDEIAKRTVRNLFSVCSHIQNPALYQPQWANNTLYTETNDPDNVAKLSVVASRDVKRGHGKFFCFIHQLHSFYVHRCVNLLTLTSSVHGHHQC